MKIRRFTEMLTAISIIAILAIPFAVLTTRPTPVSASMKFTKTQLKLLSGFASYELFSTSQVTQSPSLPGNYIPSDDDGCPTGVSSTNFRVNVNCLNISPTTLQGRGQAQNEPSIAVNQVTPTQVVASYNDYRRGDGTCGASFSLDGGHLFQDSTVPNGFTSGASFGGVPRQYWQASGDTSVAWDTQGNAYLDCQVFMRGPATTNNPDQSSAIYVYRSTGNAGASWSFLGSPVIETYTTTGAPFNDKPYMTVDNHLGGSFQDRVYVTWTVFAADGTAKIYESHSNDYAQTFSAPVLLAPTSTLCPNGHTAANTCDENQFSQPFVGPDHSLYVVFDNYNNDCSDSPTCALLDNRNQVLLVKSTDGGVTFGAPVRVAFFYDLPDCFAYQGSDFGRACVPEKGSSLNSIFRATNYPVGSVNPKMGSDGTAVVAVTFGSYINTFSKETNAFGSGKCDPSGLSGLTGNNLYAQTISPFTPEVKTAGDCSNKILVSVSTNGGATFSVTDPRLLPTVSPAAAQKFTDQWWQWAAFNINGKLKVSYYDRQYGSDESTGTMDISISTSATTLGTYSVLRVTSSSMPLPTEFPDSSGNSLFFGDYAGLATSPTYASAQPVWADTRSADLFLCPGTPAPGVPPALCTFTEASGLTANDQDIYTRNLL